ncbi:adenylate/guanylate cyclase domain-containing protein [Archangium sp.]|uniref:adenylate/guanylate cyclase domain-containing protein n=1 Tax=Archangium sp. TaxID=1872627 RepID=UPI00286D0507|nr:adenylate/guanylate cyclase domain-containing protein [Archangium sp.]
MNCSRCESEIADGLKYCTECGAAVAAPCSQCGFKSPPRSKFCGQCGTSLGPLSVVRSVEAERRQLSVLFCDLVGSTAFSEKLDPEDLHEVLQEYHSASTEVIRRFEGYVAQYLGDGLLVYFGYPMAHEDEARRAVSAGLGILQAMARLAPKVKSKHGVDLTVRIGIHTGSVVVGEVGGVQRQERLALGETPNLAARLQSLAEPGTMLISQVTYQMTQGYFTCRELGLRTLKGLSHQVVVHQVLAESGANHRMDLGQSSRLCSFVGRGQEQAVLTQRWDEARQGGSPLVLLSGEAGIGKSRHLLVLKESLWEAPHLLLECRSSAYHQSSSLFPIIDLLERRLGFSEEPSASGRFHKLWAELAHCGMEATEALPVLASLLSIPPEGLYTLPELLPQKLRQATFEALRTWLCRLAARQPVLFVLEDLHWADPSTLEFIQLLAREPAPGVFSLLTSRPEFRASWQKPERLTEVTLERLGREHAEVIAREVAGNLVVPPEVLQQVLKKADGIPLFVEEIMKALLGSGLVRQKDGRLELVGVLAADAIPATVQDSLMARLDQLSPGKALAQLAATLGREFSYEMLRAIASMEEGLLLRELRRMEEAGLLLRQGQPPQATYLFKHALIQDAAYQSLLRSTRQRYHERIVQALTRRFPEIAETQPELLAHHYTGAGLAEQAVGQWQRASQQATARSAFSEAISHLTRALEQLALIPGSRERDQLEIAVRADLGLALIATRGYATKDVEDVYVRARELCTQYGDGDIPLHVFWGIWGFSLVRGEREATERLVPFFHRLLETSDDPIDLVVAHASLSTWSFWRGDYAESARHGKEAKELVEARGCAKDILALLRGGNGGSARNGSRAFAAECLLYAYTLYASCEVIQGHVQEGLAHCKEAIALAEESGHPYAMGIAYMMSCVVAYEAGDLELLRDWAERTTDVGRKNGFFFFEANAKCSLGWLAVQHGEIQKGLTEIQEGLGFLRLVGSVVNDSYLTVRVAEAYLLGGQLDEGLVAVRESLALTEVNLSRNSIPELRRLEGEMLLKQGKVEEARASLRLAVEAAREFGGVLHEERASVSLGRLPPPQPSQNEQLLGTPALRLAR